MNSDDRTTILPASGGGAGSDSGGAARGRSGGRAARRAAERHAGRGRRSRRRGGIVPVTAVVAAVAGTGLFAALAGAGYAAYGGKQADRDLAGQSLTADALISAELGTREGIQVPGAGGTNPDVPSPATPTAADPAATPSAAATSTAATAPASPTASVAATPSGVPTPTAAAAKATPSATRTAAAGQTAAGQTVAARAAAARPAGGGASPSYAQQVVDLVNVERGKAGCGPVSNEPRLASAAQSHSDDMADRSYFDHASPEGNHADHRIEAAGYSWSTWGENIARGQKDPAAVMESWMNSPGHRANILNCSFKQLGVGVRTGANGPWWTQVFAAPA